MIRELKKLELLCERTFVIQENPKSSVKNFMLEIVSGFNTGSFNSFVYNDETFVMLSKKIPKEKLEYAYYFLTNLLITYLKKWQKEDIISKKVELDVTARLMSTVLFDISNHSGMEYEKKFHDKMLGTVIDYFVEGIFRKEEQ